MVQKGYFDSIPNTIFEAARLDGATNLQVFTKVTLPLSKSMLVYTVLTQFAWPWSDVLLPKLLLKDRNMWTVAVGLFNLPETPLLPFCCGLCIYRNSHRHPLLLFGQAYCQRPDCRIC